MRPDAAWAGQCDRANSIDTSLFYSSVSSSWMAKFQSTSASSSRVHTHTGAPRASNASLHGVPLVFGRRVWLVPSPDLRRIRSFPETPHARHAIPTRCVRTATAFISTMCVSRHVVYVYGLLNDVCCCVLQYVDMYVYISAWMYVRMYICMYACACIVILNLEACYRCWIAP